MEIGEYLGFPEPRPHCPAQSLCWSLSDWFRKVPRVIPHLVNTPEQETGKLGQSDIVVVSEKLLNMEEESNKPKRGILRNKSEDKHQ